MRIKHHTHYSVESVTERGATTPSLSSMCGLSRVSWTGGPFSMVWRCCTETSTVQYIIYNIKRIVRKLVSSWENDSGVFPLEFPLHPSPSPKEKNPRPTQKHLPIKTSSSPMHWPRCRLPENPPSTNQLCVTSQRLNKLFIINRDFVSGTNKRPRVCAVKNTHLKSFLS
jgi:hypothetical protein